MKKQSLWRRGLTVILALSMVLLVACGSSGGDASSPAAGDGASEGASTPAPDQMVVGTPKLTDSFAFFTTTNGYETFSMAQVYETLVTKDAEGNTVPLLAESFEVSEDAKTYTFHLRKGVKFSNGEEMTAEDVKFSMEQLTASNFVSYIYEPVLESVEIVDEYTVKLHLVKTSVGFMEYLCNIYYSAILNEDACTEYGEEYGKSVETIVGTGPYTVSDWKFGEYIDYVANEDYYLGAPAIKNVRLKVISDTNSAIIALQTGEIHAYFDDIPGLSYDTVAQAENVNLVDFPSTILFEIHLRCDEGIFSDVRMREALAHVVDREQLLLVGAEGKGAVADYPGNRQGFTIGDPELSGVWEYEADIEKAKALVEEAGMTGQSVTIKTYATDPYPKLATQLQSMMSQMGLNAEVLQMERSAFIDEVLGKGDFDISVCRWAAATKDVDEIMYGSLHTESIGSPGNWSWYSSADMDAILNAAAGETDPDKRKEQYGEAVKLFVKDIPMIPLYYPNGSRAYANVLKIDDGLVEYDRFYNYSWA